MYLKFLFLNFTAIRLLSLHHTKNMETSTLAANLTRQEIVTVAHDPDIITLSFSANLFRQYAGIVISMINWVTRGSNHLEKF